MATFVFDPNSAEVVSAQKKGVSKDGKRQYWLNTKTNKRFTTDVGAEENVDQNTGKLLPGKTKDGAKKVSSTAKTATPTAKKLSNKPKSVTSDGFTIIKVNNNQVKKVEGKISTDEAFALISSYFQEITKTNASHAVDVNGNTVISFNVRVGTKG